MTLEDTYYIRPCYQDTESGQLNLIYRNMAQMREQIKTPEKELDAMEISNLSDAEFKTWL